MSAFATTAAFAFPPRRMAPEQLDVVAATIAKLVDAQRDLRIEAIDAAHCELGDEQLQKLLVSTRGAWLRKLNLSRNSFTQAGAVTLAAELLPPTLVRMYPPPALWRSLCKLDLSGWPLGDEGCFQLPLHCKGLTTLLLSQVSLTDAGAPFLHRVLSNLPSLRCLSLVRNKLGPRSMIALAEAIRLGSPLESLDLAWNNIGDSLADVVRAVSEVGRKGAGWGIGA